MSTTTYSLPPDVLSPLQAAQKLYLMRAMLAEHRLDLLAAKHALQPFLIHPNRRVVRLANQVTREVANCITAQPERF